MEEAWAYKQSLKCSSSLAIGMELSEAVLEGVRLAGSNILDDKKFAEVLDTAVKGLENPAEYEKG